MDKEQLEWQRKVIREEYVNGSKQISDNATVQTRKTLPTRRKKRIERMETQVGR